MKNKKLLILIILAIFCVGITISSVSAIDNSNSTNNLTIVEESNSANSLNAIDDANSIENFSKSEDTNSNNIISVSESSSSEVLSLDLNSQDNVLSSSASKGHTYHKNGYTFTVSASQYKKIKKAIKIGKTHDWLDNGFVFKVKTNKFKKVKVLVKTKTYKKKVKYEAFKPYTYQTVKLANLKKYYKKGWKKVSTGFKPYKNKKKYLGYNYVILKKTVKKYKTVKMRVYATIKYQGWSRYNSGPHYYYPWVDFNAQKSGYSSKYLGMAQLVYVPF